MYGSVSKKTPQDKHHRGRKYNFELRMIMTFTKHIFTQKIKRIMLYVQTLCALG